LAIGLVLTPERRLLLRPAFWVGAALAGAIALPSLVWQWIHGFPFLELAGAAKTKNADIALLPFLGNQVSVMNPALAPFWLTGLLAPFVVKPLEDLRFLIIGAAVANVGVMAAVALSAVAAPVALPLLSPPVLEAYMHRLRIAPQQQQRSFKGTKLPQVMADQLGWHDVVGPVETAWSRIPVSERATTAIKVENDGEAAALDLYGSGLPPALSGHNQYFLRGLRGQTPSEVLSIQDGLDALKRHCGQVTLLGATWSRYAVTFENGKVMALCRGLKTPLAELWPRLTSFSSQSLGSGRIVGRAAAAMRGQCIAFVRDRRAGHHVAVLAARSHPASHASRSLAPGG
jgi:hypothetical protein